MDNYLLLYGFGLKKYGYQQSPLEYQAYKFQNFFETSTAYFDVEAKVIASTDDLMSELR